MKLEAFDYELPEKLIATSPLNKRSSSKMLVVDNGSVQDAIFSELKNFIQPGDLIICNNSKVIPAKLTVKTSHSAISILLDKKLNPTDWTIFAKPGKKIKVGEKFYVNDELFFLAKEKLENGQIIVEFNDNENLEILLEKYGETPLPPYIEKLHKATAKDKQSYQTVYAKHPGSVAAPTAGLHFDEQAIISLKESGINFAYVTLHVGSGTFLPIKTDKIQDHVIHSEYCEIPQDTADLINDTKQRGNKIIAVGTTSMRTIEFAAKDGVAHPYRGETNLYISPGYKFQIFDKMITNFHLPKSSLMVLVSAFAGHENIMSAYKHAISHEYRFFSYGDCCLLNISKENEV